MIGNLHTAQRIINAEKAFISYVRDRTGCDQEAGQKVLDFYRKNRLIKIDAVMGNWNVKHGAFLDLDVLQTALKMTA